jgi:hypothetical protein
MLLLRINVNQLNMEKLEIIFLCLCTLGVPSAYGDAHLKNNYNKLVLISLCGSGSRNLCELSAVLIL